MSTPQLAHLVDIGANLAHESFEHDLEAVLARAQAAGVGHLVLTGSDVAVSRRSAELAAASPELLSATAGVHPHHAKDWDDSTLPALRGLATQPQVRAVGECGLDHFRNFSTPEQQARAFRAQLELAVETGAPVFLHQRDAHQDFLAILDEYLPDLERAVAHCFTGSEQELDDLLERDLHIGITGWICDERRGHHLREFIGKVPADRLMVETDAPYLMPRDLVTKPKTRRNEPMHLPHVLAAVAAAVGRPPLQVAAETSATARAFFGIPDSAVPG